MIFEDINYLVVTSSIFNNKQILSGCVYVFKDLKDVKCYLERNGNSNKRVLRVIKKEELLTELNLTNKA